MQHGFMDIVISGKYNFLLLCSSQKSSWTWTQYMIYIYIDIWVCQKNRYRNIHWFIIMLCIQNGHLGTVSIYFRQHPIQSGGTAANGFVHVCPFWKGHHILMVRFFQILNCSNLGYLLLLPAHQYAAFLLLLSTRSIVSLHTQPLNIYQNGSRKDSATWSHS
jgi:hypothetical protein